jgi:hypothetical protein
LPGARKKGGMNRNANQNHNEKIKTTRRCYLTLLENGYYQKMNNNECYEDSTMQKQHRSSSKN